MGRRSHRFLQVALCLAAPRTLVNARTTERYGKPWDWERLGFLENALIHRVYLLTGSYVCGQTRDNLVWGRCQRYVGHFGNAMAGCDAAMLGRVLRGRVFRSSARINPKSIRDLGFSVTLSRIARPLTRFADTADGCAGGLGLVAGPVADIPMSRIEHLVEELERTISFNAGDRYLHELSPMVRTPRPRLAPPQGCPRVCDLLDSPGRRAVSPERHGRRGGIVATTDGNEEGPSLKATTGVVSGSFDQHGKNVSKPVP